LEHNTSVAESAPLRGRFRSTAPARCSPSVAHRARAAMRHGVEAQRELGDDSSRISPCVFPCHLPAPEVGHRYAPPADVYLWAVPAKEADMQTIIAGGRGMSVRRRKPLRRFPVEVLSPAEAARLVAAVRGPTATAARNKALLAVMYRSGLRLSEALALCLKDIDAESGSVRVLSGKGGRARTSGIDDGALALVRAWLALRAAWGRGDGHPLFCSRTGRAVSDAYVRRLLPGLAERAGIFTRVHAHGLRHTHAAELRAEGVDVGIISKQLGHASLATTIRYLDHVAPAAVVAAIRGRDWCTAATATIR